MYVLIVTIKKKPHDIYSWDKNCEDFFPLQKNIHIGLYPLFYISAGG